MSGKERAASSIRGLDLKKKDKSQHLPGILGVPINGVNAVEVPGRDGYVYVRLRHNLSELIQAYNDQVSPVFGLPVLVKKDDLDPTRYVIAGRDLGVYQTWGASPYLPRHGNTHSFVETGGGDVVFVANKQFLPLLVHPSGTQGARNVVIEPSTYYKNSIWYYAGNTGTADIVALKPTDGTAKLVLVYLDTNANPQLLAGSTFGAAITGSAAIVPFIPGVPTNYDVPLAAIRLVSGTSTLSWDNIYDIRPFIGDRVAATGTNGHVIADEGTPVTNRPTLNFIGSTVFVTDSGGMTNIIISGSSGAGTAATLAEAQAGTVTDKFIAPFTLPLWVRNGAIVRRDGTGSYGDNRGDGAVDLQRERTAITQVAAGNFSGILAGQNNRISSDSHRSGIIGGKDNTIIGGSIDSFVTSSTNYVSGSAVATIFGERNSVGNSFYGTAIGLESKVHAPFGGTNFPDQAIASGYLAEANLYGMEARAGNSGGQKVGLTWNRTTTNATQTEMWLDGDIVSQRAKLKNTSVWVFSILVSAKRTDATGEGAGYKFEGVIQKDLTNASVALIGAVTKTVLGESTAAWDVDVDADTTNGSLRIRVTGEVSKTIKWHASAYISQAG